MIQGGNSLCFALEPVSETCRGRLDGDFAVDARVAGAIDLAHPATADRRNDLVSPETVTDIQRHEPSGQGMREAPSAGRLSSNFGCVQNNVSAEEDSLTG